MKNPSGKCQYCHGPSPDSYTCKACNDGWPYERCRCENNGDSCDACAAWIEQRQEEVAEKEHEAK